MNRRLHLDLLIRPYRAEDEAAVIELWRTCNLLMPHNDPHRDIERKLRVNPEWFLVGEIRGAPVATCMAGYEGHRGWINYLAVAPHVQRQGIASRLMVRAEELLRAAGCPKVNLQIRPTNGQVIHFYESLGFQLEPITCMGKRLEHDAPPA